MCGTPDGLDAFSNYTLGHFLTFFLSLHFAWNGAIAISAFLSGYFVFLSLEKQFRLSRESALLGGFIYLTLSVNVPTENPTFFLPVLFVLATQWIHTRRFYWAFLLSIANAWYYLSANPQYVIYSSMFLFVYILVFLRKNSPKRHYFFLFLKTCIPFLLTLGLICFHLFRVYQLLSLSHRQQAVGGIINILFPTEWIGMIFPGYLYNSLDPTLNFLHDVIRQGILRKFLPFLKLRFLEAPYVGIVPLLLAFLLILKEKKHSIEKFLGISAVCILGYLILNPLFFFIQYIPVLKDLPVINRIYLIYGFAVSLLAAFGFAAFDQHRERASRISRSIKIITTLLLALILLRLFLWCVVSFWKNALTAFSLSHILPMVLKQNFYFASEDFYRGRILQIIAYLKCWASPLNTIYANPILILSLTFIGITSYFKGWLSRRVLFLFFLGVIFLDSFFNLRPTTAYSAQSLTPLRQEADFILQDPGLFRVLPLQPFIDPKNPALVDFRQIDTRNIVLRPETNLLYPLQTPEGYRSLVKKRYVDFFQLLAKKEIPGWLLGEIEEFDDYYADMANIKYVITMKDASLKQYDLVYESGKYKIFKNSDALPRAYIVHEAEVVNDGAKVLNRLREKKTDFQKTVLLENPRYANGLYGKMPDRAGLDDEITIETYNANELVMNISLFEDGFLVITDAFDTGWKAYLDGKQTTISRANYIFKSVKVPKGKHQVKFVYVPAIMRLGLIIASATFVLGFFLSFIDFLNARKLGNVRTKR
ncbi:MAG: YfhO family protein [Candidatus Omnitrophota bacterium]